MLSAESRQHEIIDAAAFLWFITIISKKSQNRRLSGRIEFPQPDGTARRFDIVTNSSRYH